MFDDNAAFGAALTYALNTEYAIAVCPNAWEAVASKLHGAEGDVHAIVLDADMFGSKSSFNPKGISLVDALRTNIKTDLPIVVMFSQDILRLRNKAKYFFLKRRGYYFVRQPFLCSALSALLAKAEKCDLAEDIKRFKILQYGGVVTHQCVQKFDDTSTNKLADFWKKNRYAYCNLGGFDKELEELDNALKGGNRDKIKTSFLDLLGAGDNYILNR